MSEEPADRSSQISALTRDGIASRVLSTSSVVALLGSAAYEWSVGYRSGIAARLGIAVDFVPMSSDPAQTPFVIVVLVLVSSLLAVLVASLVPAFTSWQIPALFGLFEIFLGIFGPSSPILGRRIAGLTC
jgi:uncharacterized membrane protein HdeD (DUF308 family)